MSTIQLGPEGSSRDALDFDIFPTPSGSTIDAITVHADQVSVHGVQVGYRRAATGQIEQRAAHPGTGGPHLFQIAKDDALVAVSGAHGQRAPGKKKEILAIQFETRKGVKSPVFGDASPPARARWFSLRAPEGGQIVGFFGALDKTLIRLGVHVAEAPAPSLGASEAAIATAPGAAFTSTIGTSTVLTAALARLNRQSSAGLLQQIVQQVDEHCHKVNEVLVEEMSQLRGELRKVVDRQQRQIGELEKQVLGLKERLEEREVAKKTRPDVVIAHIEYKGTVKRAESDEYAEIKNRGGESADISGWRLHAGDRGQDFFFPQGTILGANRSVRVYTNKVVRETGGFSFASKSAIWNNLGDTGRLFNKDGRCVSRYAYGGEVRKGARPPRR